MANFLEETGLSRAVPDHESIELSIPALYHELMGFIFLHERVLEKLRDIHSPPKKLLPIGTGTFTSQPLN